MSLIKKIDDTAFHFVWIQWEDGAPQSMLEYSGTVGDEASYKTVQRTLDDEEQSYYRESYAGADDPRLPEDVRNLPIGKREDWVEVFNMSFYFYAKMDDPGYDEEKSRVENAVRYALSNAYEVIDQKTEEPAAVGESLHGDPNVRRVREMYYGVDPTGFKEASDGGFSNEITVLKKGWSFNGNYYGAKVLPQLAGACQEMVVGYFNHGNTFDRDPRDWAIVTESGRVLGDEVKSSIHVFQYPDGEMLRERIRYAKEKNAPHLFGVSIDAFARISEGEAEGREGTIIEEIVRLNSVDIVMIPAAGGKFEVTESKTPHTSETANPTKVKIMDVKTLKEQHPDTAKLLLDEGREALEAEYLAKEAEMTQKLEESQSRIEELEEKLAKTEAQVDAYEAAQAQAQFEKEVKSLIESELPVEKRTDRFEKICLALGADKMDTIKEMVEERKESKVASSVIEGEGADSDNENVTEAVEEEVEEPVQESAEDRLSFFKSKLVIR